MKESEEQGPEDDPADEDAGTGTSEGSPAADRPPALPADDDSPLGDTDQHSDA